jgi:hypothetical protein
MTAVAGGITKATDVTDLEDLTVGKPLVRLVATTTQSMPDAVQTPLAFVSEDIDTHGFHDPATNNSRITPTIAGYYRFWGSYWSATLTSPATIDANIRKNGTINLAPGPRRASGGVGTWVQSSIEVPPVTVAMNGTTDYAELVGRQDSGGASTTNQSSQFSSVFEGEFVRPL